ncbi:helix-turn-helix transcriptional regulator [Rhodococcus sp. X156]|uniref:helix-turn-helix domain-containing protein n=1 Tax=Rhodococcus sp. X156 TaxID=2499145 RepID=UPI000FDC5DF6|nr:helix-turn-helix transcriptional regulator [Rhodococcus sp. X156]
MSTAETVRRNLDKQREYYGEPFGERARRLVVEFDISQAQLAAVLGVSAPMLSQVMSGRRQKLANPVALARLVLLERAALTIAGQARRRQALHEVATAAPAVVVAQAAGERGPVHAAVAAGTPSLVQALRELCGSDELARCAHLVAAESPVLARLLSQAAVSAPC